MNELDVISSISAKIHVIERWTFLEVYPKFHFKKVKIQPENTFEKE